MMPPDTNTRHPLSVRLKMLLTVGLCIIALCISIYAISRTVILGSYDTLERAAVIQDVERASDAIKNFNDSQTFKIRDWAQWDDSNQFNLDHNQTFIDEITVWTALVNLDINFQMFTDPSGNPTHTTYVDIIGYKDLDPTAIEAEVVSHKDIFINSSLDDSKVGLLLVRDGILLITSRPTKNTDGSGPSYGAITFGRFLDEVVVEQLANTTHLAFEIYRYDTDGLPEDVAQAKTILSKEEPYSVVPVSPTEVRGYGLYYDYYGKPALIIRVIDPRPVYAQGQLTFGVYVLFGAAALLIFGIIMVVLLERLVITRFVRLTSDVEKINSVHDLSIRVKDSVKDEIGKLADKINQMLTWLLEAREAEAASRREIVNLLDEVKKGKEQAEEMVVLRTQELSDEKARLLASINSLPFGFVIADKTHRILLKNPALASIIETKNPIGTVQDINALFSGTTDLLALGTEAMEHMAAAENSEVSFGKKYVRVFATPVLGEVVENGAIGYVLLIEDITEAKAVERSREEFFTIASHELRTPLTAIRGNTHLLLDLFASKIKNKEAKEMLDDIDAGSERLLDIVNDFLEVSRLEQGKIEIRNETFDMSTVIEKVVKSLGELAREKNLELSYEAPTTTLPQITADATRVEQVLSNLIGNALKFTTKGTITVRAEASATDITVHVADTGAGISPHNQTLLFRKFQQAGEDLLARNDSQSTGLGLYISKLIVTAMGGTIVLEKSVPGEGSTFAFTLPLTPSA